MSNMNFNCDVCGREVFGCTFVNGMKLCAKCYQETFGETDKDRKIADLQSQLAEKDKEQNQKAIEQLEKLKVELHIIHTNGYLKAIDEEIDNQIKKLKEMK